MSFFSPLFRAVLCFLLGILLCVWLLTGMLEILVVDALDRAGEEATRSDPYMLGPDIRHCMNGDVDLWDCIRGTRHGS